MAQRSSLAQVGGPAVAPPSAARNEKLIPFRRATTFRTTQIQTTGPQLLTTGVQNIDTIIEGSGYIYAIDVEAIATASALNIANVAFYEDAPWSLFDSVVFRDVNGELVNLSGYNLRIANLYGGWSGIVPSWDNYTIPPTNANVLTLDSNIAGMLAGNIGLGGTFRFHIYIPVGLNRRNLWGILGNQDRAQKYSLRTDLVAYTGAAGGPLYTTHPAAAGPVDAPPFITINRMYENFTVPGPADANGNPQQQTPDKWGLVNFLTQSVNPTAPAGGATVNHYLARLGNTIRFMSLVLRSNGRRANAEANLPTRIQFNLGDTPIFVETPAYRRTLMRYRYGFDAPQGVFTYDAMTDFVVRAGDELGDDYMWTSGLVNAQYQISYPAGFGSTNNSLTIVTGDMLVPPNIDIYA